eukprot:scaffold191509_cov78-Attheya_sp.AAC.1
MEALGSAWTRGFEICWIAAAGMDRHGPVCSPSSWVGRRSRYRWAGGPKLQLWRRSLWRRSSKRGMAPRNNSLRGEFRFLYAPASAGTGTSLPEYHPQVLVGKFCGGGTGRGLLADEGLYLQYKSTRSAVGRELGD